MFSARSRIAFGVTSTVVSVVLIALNIGIMPDYRDVAMQGRAQLCETIAANTSVVVRQRDLRRLEAILELTVKRNKDIVSAAVRREDGSLVVEVGNHETHWKPLKDGRATATQVMVPIRAKHEKWGAVELTFTPIAPLGWKGYFFSPHTLLVAFIGTATFLLCSIYLRKTLQQLDPSKVVPGRVRSALDTLAEGLLVLDNRQRIMLANQSFAEIIGQPPEKLLGRSASELPWGFPNQSPDNRYPWERAWQNEAPLAGVMLYLADHDGKDRTFMVNCTPIPGTDGKNRGVLASFEDVTQLEETQQALSRSKEAADTANRAKSEFLARMSHEIRTPMNAILGFTDVLRRGFESDARERQEYLDTIHASGEHLLNLINDILDLSKVESGRLEIERIACSPLQVMHEAVSVLRGQAEKKGISLTYEAPQGLPENISTDPVRFRQLLTNLVGNAIKFTEKGGVRVIASMSQDSREPALRVDVVDTGIGIPPGTMQRIFDPFVQADTSVTRRFGGTGLGLAISRRFAEALGGGITVKSEYGKGSVFTFTVDTGPLDGIRTASIEELRTSQAKETGRGSISGRLPNARILVVDDGESNRKLINLVLTRAGATVQTARNGQEAVDKVSHDSFDLILMDMQMPIMDGYTAATTLRQREFKNPIIALTADAMKGTEKRCRGAGCTGFLTKPIDMDNLVKSVGEVLLQEGHVCSPVEPSSTSITLDTSTTPGPIHSTLPTDDIDFCEIIAEFETRLRQKLDGMRTALSDRDFDELALLAHWLKGSGGTAGFHEFTDLAKELERLARGSGDEAQIENIVSDIAAITDCIVVPEVAADPA